MIRVFKYDFPIIDKFYLELPKGAKSLTVQTQRGNPQLWCLVDDIEPPEKRAFRLAGTGHPIIESFTSKLEYIGSFQMRDETLIFHLFEVV